MENKIKCLEAWIRFSNHNQAGQRLAYTDWTGAKFMRISISNNILEVAYMMDSETACKVILFNMTHVLEISCEGANNKV